MAFYTLAGKKFGNAITEWLQDTRLLSEASFRLYANYKKDSHIRFDSKSWPKPPKGDLPLQGFSIQPIPLADRMNGLLKALWLSRFIFLESLWEEYLQDLVLELRHNDASIFEPFCEKDFMANIVRDVLEGGLESIEEIKDEAAARFSAGITRQAWKDQWRQLSRLNVGLNKKDEELQWFNDLDIYFEMRNCIIHRQGRVSSLLNKKTRYFQERGIERVEVWPQHLDFYRRRFLDCVGYIEQKISAKVSN